MGWRFEMASWVCDLVGRFGLAIKVGGFALRFVLAIGVDGFCWLFLFDIRGKNLGCRFASVIRVGKLG